MHLTPCDVPQCLMDREQQRRQGQVMQSLQCGDGWSLAVFSNGRYYTSKARLSSPARYMLWTIGPTMRQKLHRSSMWELLTCPWGKLLKGTPFWSPSHLSREITKLSYLHRRGS